MDLELVSCFGSVDLYQEENVQTTQCVVFFDENGKRILVVASKCCLYFIDLHTTLLTKKITLSANSELLISVLMFFKWLNSLISEIDGKVCLVNVIDDTVTRNICPIECDVSIYEKFCVVRNSSVIIFISRFIPDTDEETEPSRVIFFSVERKEVFFVINEEALPKRYSCLMIHKNHLFVGGDDVILLVNISNEEFPKIRNRIRTFKKKVRAMLVPLKSRELLVTDYEGTIYILDDYMKEKPMVIFEMKLTYPFVINSFLGFGDYALSCCWADIHISIIDVKNAIRTSSSVANNYEAETPCFGVQSITEANNQKEISCIRWCGSKDYLCSVDRRGNIAVWKNNDYQWFLDDSFVEENMMTEKKDVEERISFLCSFCFWRDRKVKEGDDVGGKRNLRFEPRRLCIRLCFFQTSEWFVTVTFLML